MIPHRDRLLRLMEGVPRPVFATISGAHLYGFESADSDVDLRGAFALGREALMGTGRPRETVSVMRVEDGVELDWVAHDIGKSLRLIVRGSGEVLEQVLSPLRVIETEWHDELCELVKPCVTRGLHRHYAGFLASRRKLLEGARPTVKVMLYAYRAALTGIHLLRSGEVDAHLPSLLGGMPQDGVPELIERKRDGAEKEPLGPGEVEAHTRVLDELDAELRLAAEQSSLPETVPPRAFEALGDFVLRLRR